MIAKNTIYNLMGMGLPLIVAVFTIPVLIDILGAAQFGMLTLIWAIVSYFGLFDLGLGRTLTMQLSAAEANGKQKSIGAIVITAMVLMTCLGLMIGIFMILFAQQSVNLLANVPEPKQAVASIIAMGFAMPAITMTAGFRGILEARHAFGAVNLIRLPMGVYTFLGPLAAIWLVEPRLEVISWALVIGRYIALVAHAWVALRLLPREKGQYQFRSELIKSLLGTGGWLTVSNIISPFMGYADRFIIAALISATAVAYYATPYELILKLSIVPGALTAVLFPLFAAQMASGTLTKQSSSLFRQSVVIIGLVMLPICAGLAIFSSELLALWIGPEFADNSALLLAIFALGILINSLAQFPFTLVQSANRPKWTALIHLAEAAPFLAILWWATMAFGVVGAALAWFLRMIIDTTLMFLASHYIAAVNLRSILRESIPLAVLICAAAVLYATDSLIVRLVGYIILCAVSMMLLCFQPSIQTQIRQLTSAALFKKLR